LAATGSGTAQSRYKIQVLTDNILHVIRTECHVKI